MNGNFLLIANTVKTKVSKIEQLHSNIPYYSVKHKFYYKAELQDIFNQEESSNGRYGWWQNGPK